MALSGGGGGGRMVCLTLNKEVKAVIVTYCVKFVDHARTFAPTCVARLNNSHERDYPANEKGKNDSSCSTLRI